MVKEVKTGKVIKARGPKSKYDESYGRKALVLMMDGASLNKVCAALDISKDTFYRWMQTYPEFKDYIQRGKTHSEVWWEDLGVDAMLGKAKVDHRFYKTRTNQQFKWDQQENSANTIQIENLQINQLSNDDLDKKIESLSKQLKLEVKKDD